MNTPLPTASPEALPVDPFEGHTPGPWVWDFNLSNKEAILVSKTEWLPYVMKFARWGMNKAIPVFRNRDREVMEKATAFFRDIEGRKHHAEWAQTIVHPDAALIAAAPTLLAENRAKDRQLIELSAQITLLRNAVDGALQLRSIENSILLNDKLDALERAHLRKTGAEIEEMIRAALAVTNPEEVKL